MKIRVLSDLHNEFSEFVPPPASADLVVLAGDIDLGARGLRWAESAFENEEIVYVAGNHEYYRRDYLAEQREFRAGRAHFLDNEEFIFGNVRFLGATLWTDFALFGEAMREECMKYAKEGLNDFRLIGFGERTLLPEDTLKFHRDAIGWIERKLAEPFPGPTVVVTHHAPSRLSVPARFCNDPLSACFASSLERLFGRCELWIHGHTHDSFDYTLSGTRVLCNPRGYVRPGCQAENQAFDPALVVEI